MYNTSLCKCDDSVIALYGSTPYLPHSCVILQALLTASEENDLKKKKKRMPIQRSGRSGNDVLAGTRCQRKESISVFRALNCKISVIVL